MTVAETPAEPANIETTSPLASSESPVEREKTEKPSRKVTICGREFELPRLGTHHINLACRELRELTSRDDLVEVASRVAEGKPAGLQRVIMLAAFDVYTRAPSTEEALYWMANDCAGTCFMLNLLCLEADAANAPSREQIEKWLVMLGHSEVAQLVAVAIGE